MHIFKKLMRTFSIVLLTMLLLSGFSIVSTTIQQDVRISQAETNFDKRFHALHQLNMSRTPDHGLHNAVEPVFLEYFRVKQLVAPSVGDETLLTIFDECSRVAALYPMLDREILISIIAIESNFDPSCSSDRGRSLGLMQVQPQHHAARASKLSATDMFSIHDNVLVGADYFAQMVDKYNGYSYAILAYNAGPSAATRYSKHGIVTGYVNRVLDIYADISGIGGSIE